MDSNSLAKCDNNRTDFDSLCESLSRKYTKDDLKQYKRLIEGSEIKEQAALLWLSGSNYHIPVDFWINWFTENKADIGCFSFGHFVYELALRQNYSAKLYILYLEYLLNGKRIDVWRQNADKAMKLFKYNIYDSITVYSYVLFSEQMLLEQGNSSVARIRSVYRDCLQAPIDSGKFYEEYSMFETKYDNANYEQNLVVASRFRQEADSLCNDMKQWLEIAGLKPAGAPADLKIAEKHYPKLLNIFENRRFGACPPHKSSSEFALAVFTVYNQFSVILSKNTSFWENFLVFISLKMPAKQRLSLFEEAYGRAVLENHNSGTFWKTCLVAAASLECLDRFYDEFCKRATSGSIFEGGEALFELERVALKLNYSEDRLWKLYNSLTAQFPDPDKAHLWDKQQLRLLKQFAPQLTPGISQLYEKILIDMPFDGKLWSEYARYCFQFSKANSGFAVLNRALLNKQLEYKEAVYELYYESAQSVDGSIRAMLEALFCIEKHKALCIDFAIQSNCSTSKKRKISAFESDELQNKSHKAVESSIRRPHVKAEVIGSTFADRMILVKHLDANITPEAVFGRFKHCGPIEDISIWRPPPKANNPYLAHQQSQSAEAKAFVEFAEACSVQEAQKVTSALVIPCIPRDKVSLKRFGKDRDPRTLFVSPLPSTVTKYQLRLVFESLGPVREVRIVSKAGVTFAYVEFKDEASASKAAEHFKSRQVSLQDFATNSSWTGVISANISDPRASTGQSRPSGQSSWDPQRAVVVMNLPKRYEQGDINVLLEKFGSIERISMAKTKEGVFKGIAFVQFSTRESSQECIRGLDKFIIEETGKKLKVTAYETKSI